jgi:hypothetical protein
LASCAKAAPDIVMATPTKLPRRTFIVTPNNRPKSESRRILIHFQQSAKLTPDLPRQLASDDLLALLQSVSTRRQL